MQKLFAILGMSIAIASSAWAQSPAAASTTKRSDPFVVKAESVFKEELDAEKRGDADAYKRTRSKAAYDGTMANLKRMGKTHADLGPLLKRVAMTLDISKMTFIRSEAKGPNARLQYRLDGKDTDGQVTVEFLVFLMHWEDGAWRVGMVANSPGPLVFMKKERTIDELVNDPRFALK